MFLKTKEPSFREAFLFMKRVGNPKVGNPVREWFFPNIPEQINIFTTAKNPNWK
jgi:hypothetical protein